MKAFGKVESRFWTSTDIQALSGDSKLLALYLLTCEHSDLSGVYRLPLGYIAADLGWSAAMTSRSLDDLAAIDFISRRDGSDFVCINKFFQYNEPTNQGQLEARIKHLETLPDNLPDLSVLLRAMADKARVYKGAAAIVKRLDAVRERIVGSSSDDRLESKREREKENKREKTYVRSDDRTTPRTGEVPPSVGSTIGTTPRTGEVPPSVGHPKGIKSSTGATVTPAKSSKPAFPDHFEQWWSQYPKREGDKGNKTKTFGHYKTRLREGHTPESLLVNLMKYARYCDETQATGSQYVKTTTAYLNNPDNVSNHWTVNYEARQRHSGKFSLVEQVEQANAHILHPEGSGRFDGQAAFDGQGAIYDVEPEGPGEPVFDDDRPVRAEVDQCIRSG